MRKLTDLYSEYSRLNHNGCASGVDFFRNFTKF